MVVGKNKVDGVEGFDGKVDTGRFEGMSKVEKRRLIRSVWSYLEKCASEAYEQKDEVNFDWYSDGKETFFCVLQGRPIMHAPRVKPL